jgi:ribulose-5-phosphate 4-epimerase/fuculose-1-phosphate aldolase
MEQCSTINKTILQNDKKKTICYLLREFYKLGWCTGSGGGISIRNSDSSVFCAPSGVHKEFVEEDDIFECDFSGNVLTPPITPNLKISECTPIISGGL